MDSREWLHPLPSRKIERKSKADLIVIPIYFHPKTSQGIEGTPTPYACNNGKAKSQCAAFKIFFVSRSHEQNLGNGMT
jgi:hypothetical protein